MSTPPPPGGGISPPVILPADIPSGWLDKIKEAVKADRPSLFWTLLGSSVLAALIASGFSLGATFLTIQSAGNLEIMKIQLAARQAQTDAAVASYDQLDARLSQLLQKFQGVATLVEIARSNHALKNRKDAVSIKSQLGQLGVAEETIIVLQTDARIDPGLWVEIQTPLQKMAAAASDTDPNLANFSASEAAIEADLTEAIKAVRRTREKLAPYPH